MKTSYIWKIDKNKLQNILDTSSSMSEVLIKLGYNGYNGNHRTLKLRLNSDNFDLSKFLENKKQKYKLSCSNFRNKKDLSEILVKYSSYNRVRLKERLIENKLKDNKCEICNNNAEWNGKKLILQLDHINGINTDNRLENLRLLCPNCHSQSETFCGKNSSLKINKKCIDCNKIIFKKSLRCKNCDKFRKRKIKFYISKEELELLIKNYPISKISIKFNVSDNAIRKRAKKFGIDYKLLSKFSHGKMAELV